MVFSYLRRICDKITRTQMKKSIVILVVFLISVFLFYWYEFRPNEIRKDCLDRVNSEKEEKGILLIEEANNFYRVCLTRNGMKAEDLVR